MASDDTPLVVKINEEFPATIGDDYIVGTIKANAIGKTYR